ncbi:hypothetical protein GTY65_24220 [Streptomyces sp. SID8379]|uniref:hypothetical protein n=1 Tax=unclassified Streptomyces TaxID=2593676 RepID=UPI000379D2DA|nr:MULTISPECIES: hypothetical protein [unclassified Streptomyces]MYW67149.1 hypothetical protein [Streptomyces sp. SID8379]
MDLDRTRQSARFNEGKAAFAKGDPSDGSPYDEYSADQAQQFDARYWKQGWLAARTAREAATPPAGASAGQ